LSPLQLSNIRNLGKTSIGLILSGLKRILESSEDPTVIDNNNDRGNEQTLNNFSATINKESNFVNSDELISHSRDGTIETDEKIKKGLISVECKKQMMAMLNDKEFDISNLNDFETAAFTEAIEHRKCLLKALRDKHHRNADLFNSDTVDDAQIETKSRVIADEIALEVAKENHAKNEVLEILYDFYREPLEAYGLKIMFEQCVISLPARIRTLPVKPFIFAYHLSRGTKNSVLDCLLRDSSTVLDFSHLVSSNTENTTIVLRNAIPFVKWLHFDLTMIFRQLRDHLERQNKNAQYVFEKRVQGETFEKIGGTLERTREGIRQMERRVVRKISAAYHQQRKDRDIIAIISALLGGDTFIRFNELTSQIPIADAKLIWYLAKNKQLDCEFYFFSRQEKAIIFGKESDFNTLNIKIGDLPACIEKRVINQRITELVEESGFPEKFVRMLVDKAYKHNEMFYFRRSLTRAFLCDFILRTRFPNGYKIGDDSDQKRFAGYLLEFSQGKCQMTSRALDAKVSDLGILIDRGKYIHPSYINDVKDIINDVISYIESSSRVALTYAELYDTFAKRFFNTDIKNRYSLQGVLKLYGCPFIMRKDYITKDSDVNTSAEFERFIERNGKIHKSAILEEFNGLLEFNIMFFSQRLPNIVALDAGYYTHASWLVIDEDDYQKQRKFLMMVCNDTPASSRMLYDEYMLRFTDFIFRNNVESHGDLFGILQFMFREELFFSRPYISLRKDHDLTSRGVILQHISNMRSIDIDDLADMCRKSGINYLSLRSLIETVAPDFIRINQTTLMRKDITGLDDEIVFETAQQVLEIVHARGGYCASQNIEDFGWFQELDIPWNSYLLESVAALAGDLLTVLRINTSTICTPVAVFIGDDYINEDLNSLIIKLLFKENQIEPFKSKEDVFYWLQDQGLCNTKLPSFLETEGHLFYDESGKLQVQ